MIGVIGARLDHTLGNVYILEYLDELGLKGKIIDDYSEMELVSREPAYVDDSYAFFSLINITGIARGITIENAKYPYGIVLMHISCSPRFFLLMRADLSIQRSAFHRDKP